jgi:hypothetical protein
MTTAEARARAEKIFKQEEREREGRIAISQYEAQGRAVRENMARLRALRLAMQSATQKTKGV